jgi:hypothetical protein
MMISHFFAFLSNSRASEKKRERGRGVRDPILRQTHTFPHKSMQQQMATVAEMSGTATTALDDIKMAAVTTDEVAEHMPPMDSSPELPLEEIQKHLAEVKGCASTLGLQKFPLYHSINFQLWSPSANAKRDSYGNMTVYFRSPPPVVGARFFEPNERGVEIVFPFEERQYTLPGAPLPTSDKVTEPAKQRNLCVRLGERQTKWIQEMDRAMQEQMAMHENATRWFGRVLTLQEVMRDWRSNLVETANYPAFFKASVFLTDDSDPNHTSIKVYTENGKDRELVGSGAGLAFVESVQDATKWRGSTARLVICPYKLQYRNTTRTFSLTWRVTHLEVTRVLEAGNIDPFEV